MLRRAAFIAAALALFAAAPAGATSIDYGPISHSGMKKVGAASTSLKLPLQLGFVANQSGIQKSLKASSNPSSSTYGKYPSLSTLASSYGASKSKRNAVINAFKAQGVTPKVDVTHLRAGATIKVGKAQKLFGVKWNVYKSSAGKFAMPASTPKAPKGVKGNVDTIAGTRVQLSGPSSSSAARASAAAGGTPTRTGQPDFGCVPSTFPAALASSAGLYPNQLLSAYGVAPLHTAGIQGQGAKLAIVGEAPTPTADVNTFRSCFGAQGTALKIHNAGSIKPILESSLDAMVASMVAPQLSRLDLWVHAISESDDDGDVLGFLQLLAQPLQATTNGTPVPDVISVSYGVCESVVKPYTASRTLVERELAAEAAIGITVVVAAGDTGSSACARGVPASELTSSDKKAQVSWPASSASVLAVGGTNLTLDSANAIASSGAWNDTEYSAPFDATAGGGGGTSTFVGRPWWQPAQPAVTSSSKRMVPDVAAFADESPGYAIVCSGGVKGCSPGGQSIAFVGGTSAATPLVAGMVALWRQQAKAAGKPRPGFVAPLLTVLAQHSPSSFLDVTEGTNALFGGSCCPARTGFDLATGWGSPFASSVAAALPAG
jgi:subtilase family serine protease